MSGEGFGCDLWRYVVPILNRSYCTNNNVLGRENIMGEVRDFFGSLWETIYRFNRYPNHVGAAYTHKVEQWISIARVSLESLL